MGITSLRQYHEAPVAAEVSSEAPAAGEAPAEATAEAPTDAIEAATLEPAVIETVVPEGTEVVELEGVALTEVELAEVAKAESLGLVLPVLAEASTEAVEVETELPDPFEPEAAPVLDDLNRGSSRAAWAAYGEAEAGVVAGWTDGMTRDQLVLHYLGVKAE